MNDITQTGIISGFTRKTVSINVRLHYLLGGNPKGPPVLLWHGFLSTSYAWRKVMPALANAGCAVLVPDMRGYGDSESQLVQKAMTPVRLRKSSARLCETSALGPVARLRW